MSRLGLLALYSLLTLLASLAGGWLPMVVRFNHRRMQMLMSFVAGLMLGVAVFIMLPHAAEGPATLDQAVTWLMFGLLTMFFLLRAFHFHQHEPLSPLPATGVPNVDGLGETQLRSHSVTPGLHEHDHDHVGHNHPDHEHHGHSHSHADAHGHQNPLSWVGIGIGLTIHSLLDGIAMAAGVQAGSHAPNSSYWIGFGTFLAILLHKPLDAMAITTLMTAGGASTAWRQFVNAAFGLMCPLGAVLFFLYAPHESSIVSCALAFSAGVFLCISLSDLLPEIQFHAHDRIKLSALLLLGVGTAYATGLIEHASHTHGETPKSEGDHSHEPHGHTHHGAGHEGHSH